MFKNAVYESALTTQAASEYFGNITGSNFAGDVTFLATLRAFLGPRMPENESVQLVHRDSVHSKHDVESISARELINSIINNDLRSTPGRIFICNICSHFQEDNDAVFAMLEEKFLSFSDGYVKQENVTAIFRKNFKVLAYTNESIKTAIVFVENLSVRKYHYLQGVTLGLTPWYFNREAGFTEAESELLGSFIQKESTPWETAIRKIASQFDFNAGRIRRLLRGIEAESDKRELERQREQAEGHRREIQRLDEQIGAHLEDMNNCFRMIAGLEARINSAGDNSEIMEYFLHNKSLCLENVSGSTITFVVKDYITYYDEDMVERILDNEMSFVYSRRDGGNPISCDQMRKLMQATFIDQEIKIRTCAAYEFDLNGNVRALQYYDFGEEYADCTPNPHIDGYRCMGGYERAITKILNGSRDYIAVFEQAVASGKSLNWGDTTVMEKFFSTLYGRSGVNNKAFELPDGSVVTPVDAIKWLESREEDRNE